MTRDDVIKFAKEYIDSIALFSEFKIEELEFEDFVNFNSKHYRFIYTIDYSRVENINGKEEFMVSDLNPNINFITPKFYYSCYDDFTLTDLDRFLKRKRKNFNTIQYHIRFRNDISDNVPNSFGFDVFFNFHTNSEEKIKLFDVCGEKVRCIKNFCFCDEKGANNESKD